MRTVRRTGLYPSHNYRMYGGRFIWIWTRAKLGIILRRNPRHLPPDWTIRPAFQYWPRKCRRHSYGSLTIWSNAYRRISLEEFKDFLDEHGGSRITDHSNALTLAGTRTYSDVPPWRRELGSEIPYAETNRNARHAISPPLKTCFKSQSNSSFSPPFPSSYHAEESSPMYNENG
jgi:hypothetical protein